MSRALLPAELRSRVPAGYAPALPSRAVGRTSRWHDAGMTGRATVDGHSQRQRGPGPGPGGRPARGVRRGGRAGHPYRRRPQPLGVHPGRPNRARWPTPSWPGRRRRRGDRPERARRPAPVRGRAGRDARGVPGRRSGAAPPAPRRSTAAGRVGGELELPVFLYGAAGHAARAPRARGPSPRRLAAAGGAHGERGAGARLRAAAGAPHGGGGAGHGPPAPGGVQRGPGDRRPRAGARRSPPRSASRHPAACRGCARSACCWPSAGGRRSRPTSTTTARRRWREVVEAVRARAPVAEAELVGLAPQAAFDGFPADVPLRDFDPARHLIENALRSLS